MINNVSFLRPFVLTALLVVVPMTCGLLALGYRARLKARRAYGEASLVNTYSAKLSRSVELAVAAAWAAAIALVVIAIAGPTIQAAPDKVPAGSLKVVVVSDVSKSMAAEDYRQQMPGKGGVSARDVPGSYGSRLQAVKQVVEEQIMPAITGNQLGVSTYCGNGFDQADLTDDFVSLRWVIDHWMQVGNAPGGGSDYAEGLSMALKIFDSGAQANEKKVIVLFSDGGFTGDQAALSQVVDQIKRRGIRLVIVGVGLDKPIPIPQYETTSGQLTGYVKDGDTTVTTGFEASNLESLVAQSGATYVRLNPNHDLNVQWASKLTGSKVETHEKHVFQYPLSVTMVLLLALFMRGAVIRRRSR